MFHKKCVTCLRLLAYVHVFHQKELQVHIDFTLDAKIKWTLGSKFNSTYFNVFYFSLAHFVPYFKYLNVCGWGEGGTKKWNWMINFNELHSIFIFSNREITSIPRGIEERILFPFCKTIQKATTSSYIFGFFE